MICTARVYDLKRQLKQRDDRIYELENELRIAKALKAENTEPVEVDLQKELKDYFTLDKLRFNKRGEVIGLWNRNLNNYPYPLPASVKWLWECNLENYDHPIPFSIEILEA